MLLETLRAGPALARTVFIVGVLAAMAAALHQLRPATAPKSLPGEIHVDRLAILGKLVVLGCGLALALGLCGQNGYKFWLLVASSLLGAMLILAARVLRRCSWASRCCRCRPLR
jgi:hypothetical protein